MSTVNFRTKKSFYNYRCCKPAINLHLNLRGHSTGAWGSENRFRYFFFSAEIYNLDVSVTRLFACPDFFQCVVDDEKWVSDCASGLSMVMWNCELLASFTAIYICRIDSLGVCVGEDNSIIRSSHVVLRFACFLGSRNSSSSDGRFDLVPASIALTAVFGLDRRQNFTFLTIEQNCINISTRKYYKYKVSTFLKSNITYSKKVFER